MITATLLVFEVVRAEFRITILYTDTVSGKSIEKSYRRASITKTQLRDLARAEAAGFVESADESDVDIPIGTVIDVTPIPPTPPTPPTQEELDKAAWFEDYRQLQQLLQLTTDIPALETPQAAALIASLRVSLEADWENSYLGDI